MKKKAPDLASLEQLQADDVARLEQLRAELDRIFQNTSPYRFLGRGSTSRADALRLKAREPDARREALELEADIDERGRVLADLVRAERERARAKAREQLGPRIPQLHAKLADLVSLLQEMIPFDEAAGTDVTAPFRVLVDEPCREGLLSISRDYCRRESLSK